MKKFLFVVLILTSVFLSAEDAVIDILFTNDLHGGIDRYPATFMNPNFPPIIGGGASAATYIKRIRALSNGSTRDNLLIDAGDFFQGHPIGTVSNGKSIIKYMNMIKYDLTVIGNHEYDIGEEKLIETYKTAKFPVMSCNVIDKRTGKLVDYAIPYIIVEKSGVKIGIIGLTTTDTELMSFPENIKNVRFRNAKEALEEYIPIVKKEGVNLIIVVGHMGLPYRPESTYKRRYLTNNKKKAKHRWGYDAQQLAHEVKGIDLFIGGHMHKGHKKPWIDPVTHTIVTNGYAYGSNIGHLILKVDKKTKTLSGWSSPAYDNILVTLFEDEFIPDPVISDTILKETKKAEAGMDKIIGTTNMHIARLGSGPQNLVGNLIVDIMKNATDADFAFINLGGIRGDIKRGPITYRDIFNVMPFDNQLVVFEADGRFLKSIIEKRVEGGRHGLRVSGIEVVINKERPNFDRVTKLLINGQPWNPNKIYRIATSDFLMEGNAGLTMLTRVKEKDITRLENSLRDEIVNYIIRNSPVSSKIDNRWKRNDNSELTPELEKALNTTKK